MQIPRRPASRPAGRPARLAGQLWQRIFRDTGAPERLFGHPRGMEIPHRQGRVNFDMYVRNRRANYTAGMHNAWQPNGNRLHQAGKRGREEGKRQGSNRRCLLSLSLWCEFATLHDSSSESETFNPLHPRHSACAVINIKDHFQF